MAVLSEASGWRSEQRTLSARRHLSIALARQQDLGLSDEAVLRLKWMMCYLSDGCGLACTGRRFDIPASTFCG